MPDTHRIAERLAHLETQRSPADTGPVSTREPQEHISWFPLTDHDSGYLVVVIEKGDMTDEEQADLAQLAYLLSGDPWEPKPDPVTAAG